MNGIKKSSQSGLNISFSGVFTPNHSIPSVIVASTWFRFALFSFLSFLFILFYNHARETQRVSLSGSLCVGWSSQTIFPALGERKRENETERQSNRMNRYISQIQRHTHAGGRTNIVETKSGDECTIYTCFCLSFPRNPLKHQMFLVFFSSQIFFCYTFFIFCLLPLPPFFLFFFILNPLFLLFLIFFSFCGVMTLIPLFFNFTDRGC